MIDARGRSDRHLESDGFDSRDRESGVDRVFGRARSVDEGSDLRGMGDDSAGKEIG